MPLRKLYLSLFLFFSSFPLQAQQVDKQFILTLPDTTTTQLQKAALSFGAGGDFCLYYRGRPYLLVTETKTYGPFKRRDDRMFASLVYNEKGKDQYLTHLGGGPIYGPYDGTVTHTGYGNMGAMAYTVAYKGNVDYFINGAKVATTDSSIYMGEWCTFSRNGNNMYTTKKGAWNYLFINGKLHDSSQLYYSLLKIDEKNNYCYALGNFEAGDCKWRRFIALPRKGPKVFSPVMEYDRLLWSEDDSIRYYGNDNGIVYSGSSIRAAEQTNLGFELISEGKSTLAYHSGLRQISDSATWEPATTSICINGVKHDLPYSEIIMPRIDSSGHFALFGRRGYYLYVNVNGIEGKEPLSKYGVRATPVSIDAFGNYICYYPTEDSVYVYENNILFRKCALEEFQLVGDTYGIWFNVPRKVLPILCIDTISYIVYKNTLSPPLLQIKAAAAPRSGTFNAGEVIYSDINEFGYWLLQKTDDGKYGLIINQRKIPLPPGISFEGPLYDHLRFNFRLTATTFIFYTKEGSNIYRYKIAL